MRLPLYEDLPRRRPWRLAWPIGSSWLGDTTTDPLRMWTTQSEFAYRVLAATGVLRADPVLADPDFQAAYSWMRQEADRRLTTTGPGLLWLYAKGMRSEVRRSARQTPGEVLLEVAIPRDRALLSGFDQWHEVLNTSLIVPMLHGETDDEWWVRVEPLKDDFEARLRAAGHDTVGMQDHRLWPDDLRVEIEMSWRSIFDPSTWHPREHVQCVVHEICAEHVVKATRIL